MKTLKENIEKEINREDSSVSCCLTRLCARRINKDVKNAVLKFKERLSDDEAVFNGSLSAEEYCKKYNLSGVYEDNINSFFDKIFGDFEE